MLSFREPTQAISVLVAQRNKAFILDRSHAHVWNSSAVISGELLLLPREGAAQGLPSSRRVDGSKGELRSFCSTNLRNHGLSGCQAGTNGKFAHNPTIQSTSQRTDEETFGQPTQDSEALVLTPNLDCSLFLSQETEQLAHTNEVPSHRPVACSAWENFRQDPIFPKRFTVCFVLWLPCKINHNTWLFHRILTSCIFMNHLDSKSEGNLE